MNNQPHHPGKPSLHFYFTKLCHGTITSYSRHRTQITVMERFHLPSFLYTYQILCQQFSLLDSHLSQLRMSVRVIFISNLNTLVTNNKHITHSLYAIERIDLNTSTTSYQRRIHVADSHSGNTAHPNKSTRSNLRTIFKYHFMVTIIYNAFVQQDIYPHFTEKLFGMSGRIFRHSSKQSRPGLNQIYMHQATRHIRIIFGQDKFLHFGKYSGYLYSGCSTSYNDDIHQLLLFLFG